MKAFEPQAAALDLRECRWHTLCVDAELLGSAAHLHSSRLQLEVGVDAHCNAGLSAKARADVGQELDLAFGLHVDQNAGRDSLRQLRLGFRGSGEADVARVDAGIQRDKQLGAGSDIQAIHQTRHEVDDGRHRVRLHGVVQADGPRQHGPQLGHTLRQQGSVVGIKRRSTHARGDQRQRLPADGGLPVDPREALQR